MAILSQRTLTEVYRTCHRACGVRPRQMDLGGRLLNSRDPLGGLARVRRERAAALHESVNLGGAYLFAMGPVISSWLVALEDRRIIHGALVGGEVVCVDRREALAEGLDYLRSLGMGRAAADGYLHALPVWPARRVEEAARFLEKTFYQVSGWKPQLMQANRLRVEQQQQLAEAIDDQKRRGECNASPFEKERILLAHIRAGDREGARSVLNETLAAMYMTSPRLVLLRARAIEMMGYLTRAAVEDSPVLEALIERNHGWMEKLIRARDFEELSRVLVEALNDFIEGIALHGFNRTSIHVSKVLDYIRQNYMKPVTLQAVAREVGISSFRMAHLVKEHTGKSILQILHQIRVREAQQLLEHTDKSCTDIAYAVGFGDQSYFIKHFRRLTGITPARYRRTCHLRQPPKALDI